MVLTVVPFRSLGGCSSTSKGKFIGCAGTGRVVVRIIAGRAIVVITGFVVFQKVKKRN